MMAGACAHGATFFLGDYTLEENKDNVLPRVLEHKEAITLHLSWVNFSATCFMALILAAYPTLR